MTRAYVIAGWRIDITARPGVSRLVSAAEVARVVVAALVEAGAPSPASLTVVLSDDAELAELNAAHLGHLGPTDVLSFPLLPPEAFPPHAGRPHAGRPHAGRPHAAPVPADSALGANVSAAFVLPPRTRPHLGDIAVSVERAIAQASEGRGGHTGAVRWAPADELRLLLTHGALHICGWDHAEPAEAAAMRAVERHVLGIVPD